MGIGGTTGMRLDSLATLDRLNPLEQREKTDWYLVRTKGGKEKWVSEQLAGTVPEIFLPMLRTRVRRWKTQSWSLVPLFPGYLFARFELARHYGEIRYTSGVHEIVSAGGEAIPVPYNVMENLRERAGDNDGVVEIAAPEYAPGDSLKLTEGPLKGLNAVFDRYLSGGERVAILLGTIGSAGCRVVLPEYAIARDG